MKWPVHEKLHLILDHSIVNLLCKLSFKRKIRTQECKMKAFIMGRRYPSWLSFWEGIGKLSIHSNVRVPRKSSKAVRGVAYCTLLTRWDLHNTCFLIGLRSRMFIVGRREMLVWQRKGRNPLEGRDHVRWRSGRMGVLFKVYIYIHLEIEGYFLAILSGTIWERSWSSLIIPLVPCNSSLQIIECSFYHFHTWGKPPSINILLCKLNLEPLFHIYPSHPPPFSFFLSSLVRYTKFLWISLHQQKSNFSNS